MSNFSQFHADSINTQHKLLSVPDCKLAPVDASDIGEAAANLLVSESDGVGYEHHKSIIDCCGPNLYTHSEMADEMSKGVGRTIGYSDPPSLEEWLETTDHPAMLKETYSYLTDQESAGKIPFDPDFFASILGRSPTSLREWANVNRVLFGGKGF